MDFSIVGIENVKNMVMILLIASYAVTDKLKLNSNNSNITSDSMKIKIKTVVIQ